MPAAANNITAIRLWEVAKCMARNVMNGPKKYAAALEKYKYVVNADLDKCASSLIATLLAAVMSTPDWQQFKL